MVRVNWKLVGPYELQSVVVQLSVAELRFRDDRSEGSIGDPELITHPPSPASAPTPTAALGPRLNSSATPSHRATAPAPASASEQHTFASRCL